MSFDHMTCPSLSSHHTHEEEQEMILCVSFLFKKCGLPFEVLCLELLRVSFFLPTKLVHIFRCAY